MVNNNTDKLKLFFFSFLLQQELTIYSLDFVATRIIMADK